MLHTYSHVLVSVSSLTNNVQKKKTKFVNSFTKTYTKM